MVKKSLSGVPGSHLLGMVVLGDSPRLEQAVGGPLLVAIAPILTRNNVHQTGEGAPLLFAHGFGCDQSVWRHVAKAFPDRRVILFDHVGAGNSDVSAYSRFKYRSLRGYAHDIVELCEELGLEDVTLVGHSVSAVIGALAVLERPERFAGLVMVAPSPCYINHDGYVGGFTRQDIDGLLDLLDTNHLGWSAAMAPVIMGNSERPELSAELEGNFCRTDPEIARHFARATFLSNNLSDLARLPVRSISLQCMDDAIAPLSVGEHLNRIMNDNHLMVMKARGHCPHLSAPEETIGAIRRFLDSEN
ncbi:MAG: alpha/beta fold hydrolase [Janthinobacterium lividum]